MAEVRTPFISRVSGFQFPNRFEFPNFPQFNLPFVRSGLITLGEVVYGLCGGMSFTALDYFYAQAPVPAFTAVDDINLKLFLYLWNRQLDSFGKDTLQRLVASMLTDDISLGKMVAQKEIPKLRARLDAGDPAVLLLVRVRGIVDPTQNHQVVATGYQYDDLTDDMTIFLYEPNHPGMEPVLTMNLSKPAKGIKLAQSTGETLRGFFVLDYDRQPPP